MDGKVVDANTNWGNKWSECYATFSTSNTLVSRQCGSAECLNAVGDKLKLYTLHSLKFYFELVPLEKAS